MLRTGDGSIRGSDLAGTLRARTGDGDVRLQGRFDGLELQTGDGTVEVTAERGSQLGPGWTLSTSDGPMTLHIPSDLDADLDARTSDGSIRLGIPVRVEGRFPSSRVRGRINDGGPLLVPRTGDGPIALDRLE